MDNKNRRKEMLRVIEEVYGLDSPQVVKVMLQIPRHKFVNKVYKPIAYSDRPVPIGAEQTMSQPYTVAYMTHLLLEDQGQVIDNKIKRWKVLEIGTGSGYQAAVLSKLVKEIYTVEVVEKLVRKARKTLKSMKIDNVFLKSGNGVNGWVEKAPFDAIIITAGLEGEIPHNLVDQLKKGGIIVAPIGPRHLQTMTRFTKASDGHLEKEEFEKFIFVPFVD